MAPITRTHQEGTVTTLPQHQPSLRYWNHDLEAPEIAFPEFPAPSDVEEYLFDLQGFVVLRQALSPEEVAECNQCVDDIPDGIEDDAWYGYVHKEGSDMGRGVHYQQIYEAGTPFERLIDHPSYINYLLRFVGGQDTFDEQHGPLFIDENFFDIKRTGGYVRLHGGAHDRCKRTQYGYHNGRFQCGQINVLIAHTDIGPGDGPTLIVPGSHKSNIVHPEHPRRRALGIDPSSIRERAPVGAIEVFMEAGDALLFVDSCCHASAARTNPGDRRISIYRYGSAWNRTRMGYQPSAELISRLSPFAAGIVSPARHGLLVPPAG
jgi:Phytanoyl-CoA dioxygenase (PhyH)